MTTIAARIEAISARNTKLVSQQATYELNTRKAIWSLMAEVYALGLATKEITHAFEYDALLEARGIKPAKPDENEWLKVIQVSCGRHIEKKTSKGIVLKWQTNASMSKYARALRHMERKGVDPAVALDFIADERDWVETGNAGNRRHLIGMAEADKLVMPTIKRKTTNDKAIKRAASEAQAGVSVNFGRTKRRQFIRVTGYVENGQFFPVAPIENSEDAARRDLHKMGLRLIAEAA